MSKDMGNVPIIPPSPRGKRNQIIRTIRENALVDAVVRSFKPRDELGLDFYYDYRDRVRLAVPPDTRIPKSLWQEAAKPFQGIRFMREDEMNFAETPKLPPFIALPHAVQLVGSSVVGRPDHEPADRDILLRINSRELFDYYNDPHTHIIIEPLGSTWTHISLAHAWFIPEGSPLTPEVVIEPVLLTEDGSAVYAQLALIESNRLKFERLGLEVIDVPPEHGIQIGVMGIIEHEPILIRYPEDDFYNAIGIAVRDLPITKVTLAKRRNYNIAIKPQKAFDTPEDAAAELLYRFDSVIVEPKYDGVNVTVVYDHGDVAILTEDTGHDIAPTIPSTADGLQRDFGKNTQIVFKAELVGYREGKPLSRWLLAPIVHGKEPVTDIKVKLWSWDLIELDGEDYLSRPYIDRIRKLHELRGNPFHPVKFVMVTTEKALIRMARAMRKVTASEGAIFRDPNATGTEGIWKWRDYTAVNARIIGYMKKAAPIDKPDELEGDEAYKLYRKAQENSSTYILRCALKCNGKEVPVLSRHTLTPGDLRVRISKGQWRGLEDPRLWVMMKGWPHRKEGELAYGSTYAVRMDEPPKLGSIITVKVQEIIIEDGVISWIFPTPVEPQPELEEPDDVCKS